MHYGSDGTTKYSCHTPMTRHMCQEVHGRYVEPLVEEELLKPLNQEELELARHYAVLRGADKRACNLIKQSFHSSHPKVQSHYSRYSGSPGFLKSAPSLMLPCPY